MEYRYLGRSGLKVSTLTMGTMTFGGAGGFAAAGKPAISARRAGQIDLCIDAGINLIDTANVYSQGVSEEIIGEALGGKRQDDVLIASKARMRIGQGPNDEGLSRYHVIREFERSLAPAQDRCHRHPLPARMGRHDPAGRDARRARHAGRAGQDPLRRLLELFRLAPDEGAGHQRARGPPRPSPSRSTTRWKRARPNTNCADLGGPGAWRAGLEPARRRPAFGQVRPATALRPPARPAGTSRRSATTTGCGASSTC